MQGMKGSPGAPSSRVPIFPHSPVVQRFLAHPESQCTSTAGSENNLQTCRCKKDQYLQIQEESVLPEQEEHMEGAKCMWSLHPLGSSGLSWCSFQAACPLERGAPCAGSSFQKHFFILAKSSIQTFPFCSKSLQTLAKPFPLIFLHLTKTTQTVCLQGRLSQDMGEESIICNARKYNLHISKAFSVKTNAQQRLEGQTPHCLQATVLSNHVSNSLSKPN